MKPRASKFTINLSAAQNASLDKLAKKFGTATQAELFRKLIALGEFVVEEGQRLALVDDEGRLSARVRLL
jgi:ribosome maturation protein Sdo1